MIQQQFDQLVQSKAEEKQVDYGKALDMVAEDLEWLGVDYQDLYDNYISWLAS
jgi:hypothetical protein